MTEETELSTFNASALIPAEDTNLATVATRRAFLPNLKLFAAQSAAVIGGKIGMAHMGLQKSKDSIVDLGKTVDLIFYTYRYKAVEKVGGEYINYYHLANETFGDEFKRTTEKSKDKNSGCMSGVEFLVWIPSQNEFAIYYANNTSALGIVKSITALLTKPATLGSELVKTKDFSWYAPTVTLCSTEVSQPQMAELQSVGQWFLSPKKSSKEVDEETTTTSNDRR